MEKFSLIFLKVAVLLLGIPILLLCIFAVPQIGYPAEGSVPNWVIRYVQFGVPILLYLSAIPYYFALYQTFRLIQFIEKKQAFSTLSTMALKKIKNCAWVISGLHLLLLPFFYVFAELDDAPGVIFVGLVVPFASIVIAIFATVLQRLLQEAIEMKTENDLTV